MSRSLALGSIIAFSILLAGCTNSSTTTINRGGSGIIQIVVTDVNNNRIVSFTDMTGANWAAYGTPGNGVGQFQEPLGVAFDSTHRIYVTDFIGPTFQRVDRINDITGAGWTTFGTPGNGVDQFSNPTGIALDSMSRIYVADDGTAQRIDRFDDMTGTNWVTFGSAGSGVHQFDDPFGTALDAAGRIYAADFQNNRIVRFDDMIGTNWVAYGTTGSGIGNFAGPSGIAVDLVGRIYIVDGENDRIVRINDMTGAGWTSLGTTGSGVNQFKFTGACGIGSIAIGPDQRIYIADSGNNRIVRIDDMTGANWTAFGTLGAGVDNFNIPVGIAVR
jgi:sugar lactone lactonase YvrE